MAQYTHLRFYTFCCAEFSQNRLQRVFSEWRVSGLVPVYQSIYCNYHHRLNVFPACTSFNAV